MLSWPIVYIVTYYSNDSESSQTDHIHSSTAPFIWIPNDHPKQYFNSLNRLLHLIDHEKLVPWSVDLERFYCIYMPTALHFGSEAITHTDIVTP